MDYLSTGVIDDDKAIEQFEMDRWNNNEIHRRNALLVVLKKGPPCLPAAICAAFHHVFGNGRL